MSDNPQSVKGSMVLLWNRHAILQIEIEIEIYAYNPFKSVALSIFFFYLRKNLNIFI